MAELLVEELDNDQALACIERIVAFFIAHAKKGERLGRMIDRLGLDALREAAPVTA